MSRIKIALKDMEIEFEGEQSFIEESLLTFAEKLIALNEAAASAPDSSDAPPIIQHSEYLSTNTIAQLTSAKTGSDLALAAIARINLILKKSSAQRTEILEEMKEATTYFKDTYVGNLSSYLNTLVKSRKVNLVARASYALAAGERNKFESVLASRP